MLCLFDIASGAELCFASLCQIPFQLNVVVVSKSTNEPNCELTDTFACRFKKDSCDKVSEVVMSRLKSRRSFRSVQKQCCQLLDALGIPHRESEGEGEKLCAILNQQGEKIFTVISSLEYMDQAS